MFSQSMSCLPSRDAPWLRYVSSERPLAIVPNGVDLKRNSPEGDGPSHHQGNASNHLGPVHVRQASQSQWSALVHHCVRTWRLTSSVTNTRQQHHLVLTGADLCRVVPHPTDLRGHPYLHTCRSRFIRVCSRKKITGTPNGPHQDCIASGSHAVRRPLPAAMANKPSSPIGSGLPLPVAVGVTSVVCLDRQMASAATEGSGSECDDQDEASNFCRLQSSATRASRI